MSQHDYNLANASGPNFRADANAALGAVATLNAGPTAPTTTFANMLWYDSTTGYLKKRDNANTTWQVLFSLDTSGNVTFKPGANDRNIDLRNATDAVVARLRVDSGGDGRINAEDRNSVLRVLINGSVNGGCIFLDGDENTGKQVAPVLSLPAFSLAGLTGQTVAIPAGATGITLNFRQVVQPGTGSMVVQLGTSSGIVATGYIATSSTITAGLTLSAVSGFPVRMGTAGASAFGSMHVGIADNPAEGAPTWASSHAATFDGDSVAGGGAIALSSLLTQLRVSGQSAFTTGVILIQVRF